MSRDSMVFYKSFVEGIAELDEKDQLEAFWNILNYALDGREPEGKGAAKAIFKMAKPQIDKNNQKYENGKKGGRIRTNCEPNENQTETNPKPTRNQLESKEEKSEANVNDNDNVNDNVINYQLIADMYNDTCVSYPHLTKLSDRRRKAIKARLKAGYTLDDFRRLFKMAEESEFLKGSNGRNWSATFDWMIQDGNMAKVLDGNYQSGELTQKGGNHDTSGKNTGYDKRLQEFIESGGGIPEFTGF